MAIVYAWPLLVQLTTAIPGTSDFLDVTEYIWNVGWVQFALLHGASWPVTDRLFVPFGADLRLDTFAGLQSLIALPFLPFLGVVGAYNAVLVLTMFLNGALTYALVFHESRHVPAALIAAVWLMLGMPVLSQLADGRAALGALWLVAACLLLAGRLFDRPYWCPALALGLGLVAALLSDFQLSLFVVLWLVLYGAWRFWHDRLDGLNRRRALYLWLAIVILLIPFGLIYYPALAGASAAGYPTPSLDDMIVYSFALQHYVTPSTIEVAYGYEFLATTLAALCIFHQRGPYRFWLAGSLCLLVLALGPFLQPTRIPLPLALLNGLPLIGQFRTPSRFTIPAQVGLAVVASHALAALLPRVRSRPLVAALVTLAVGVRLFFALNLTPLATQTYPVYAIYDRVAAEPGDFTLLEVPFGVRSGLERIGKGGEVFQYYQHIHGKRLIGGSIARLPTPVFQFYRMHPVLIFFSGELLTASQNALARDLVDIVAWSQIHYILVHRALLTADQSTRIEEFLNQQPQVSQVDVERDVVIYQVAP